jgi:serine beta-lactamase-like protein LACTB, mitochondrial
MTRMTGTCAVLITSILALPAHAWADAASGSAEGDAPAGRNTEADELLEQALAADHGAGMMAAVMKAGAMVYSGVAGSADLEHGRAMTRDTRVRVGSVSKIVTATLAASLIDRTELDPDADIHALVPEFPRKPEEQGSPITVRMLADHTSGIRHYDFQNVAEANNQRYYENLADALAVFSGDPLVASPGAAHHYSSFGFNLLGVAAGRAAGADFATAVMSRVVAPLGLANTMPDHPLTIIPRRAGFYTVFGGKLINTFWRDSSDYYPSGGMLTSAEDLVRLTHAVFEGDFLGPAGAALIRKETASRAGPTGFSFGWQVKPDADGTLHYEHGGETNGAHAWVYYDPETRLIVAGATNYNVYPRPREVAFFAQAMTGLRRLYGGPEPRASP